MIPNMQYFVYLESINTIWRSYYLSTGVAGKTDKFENKMNHFRKIPPQNNISNNLHWKSRHSKNDTLMSMLWLSGLISCN